MTKNELHTLALDTWKDNGHNGLLAMCTGSGKSRVAILADQYVKTINSEDPILIVVPTETLRDVNWKEQYLEWGSQELYDKAEKVCYASLNTLKNKKYSLVVFDEFHNITEANSVFLDGFINNNVVERILSLSATVPKDDKKILIMQKYCPVVFDYPLEQGVKDGIVSDFELIVVYSRLDNSKYVIPLNKKAKTTEYLYYNDLSLKRNKAKDAQNWKLFETLTYKRLSFIYNLQSKLETSKKVLEKMFNDEMRYLIFTGSTNFADELCEYRHHSNTKDSYLSRLKSKEVNKISCVKALNEGENIEDIDAALVEQLDSNDKNLKQRIGRCIRFKEGKKAKIYIIVAKGTVDEKWANMSLSSIPESFIKRVYLKDLINA